MSVTFSVFHSEKSGKDIKVLQPLNMPLILVIFLVLALAIGGGVAYIYIYNPFGDNPQGEPTKSNNQIDIFKDASDTITGTYKSDNGFIGICNAGKYGYANIKTNTGKTVELYGTIKDGVFEYHSNGIDYVIELDDERVELDTNDSSLLRLLLNTLGY